MSGRWRSRVAGVADLVARAALGQPPTLGGTRLVCVDGRAGAGKTTLAEAIRDRAAEEGTTVLVHVDDLLDGWRGLFDLPRTLEHDVLAPLRAGRAGRYRRYDWLAGRFASEVRVKPVDVLVVEGVGCGASAYSSSITALVWVEAPRELRLARGMARDGEQMRRHWLEWMDDEDILFAQERTWERADFVVDGSGEADPVVVPGGPQRRAAAPAPAPENAIDRPST